MKKALSIAVASALGLSALVSTGAQAAASGNIAVSNNYLWRGVTQTMDEAAVSGGLDYEDESGFYAGAWFSNVDFGDQTSYELDLYGGYAGEVGDIGYDVGYIYYGYDSGGDNELDFGEIYGGVSYGAFSLTAYYTVNTEDSSLEEDGLYVDASAGFEVAKGLTVGVHVGSYSGDDIEAAFGDDYIDYNISLTKATDLGDVSFMVSDTDLPNDDPSLVIGWSYGFDL